MEYIKNLIKSIEETKFSICGKEYESYEAGINEVFEIFSRHKAEGSNIFFVGNGGSAAIASHMTVDFMKNGGMRTVSLLDSSVITCMGNDFGYDYIFSKPLSLLCDKGDLLIAISSSGKSKNIINAIEEVQKKGGEVITFTGFLEDNPIRRMSPSSVYVPFREYGTVESIHNLILQQIVDMLLARDGARLK